MPDLQTLAALRYNTSRAPIDAAVAPPYDVISPAEQDALLARDPLNIVRIELPREEQGRDKYESAAILFRQWIADGVLVRDDPPGFYIYDQEFTNAAGKRVTRHGFFAACRLEEFSRGNVLPHEKTLSGPKEDRLKLLRAVQANVSPIFALYLDPDDHVRRMLEHGATPAEYDFTDASGVRHIVRRATGGRVMDDVREAMLHRKAYIADGHHRYETALKYRDEMRAAHPDASPDAPWNFILMYLAAMEDPGMEIQATHRLLHTLPNFNRATLESSLKTLFKVETLETMDKGLAALQRAGSDGFLFAYPGSASCTLATLHGTVDRASALGSDIPAVLYDVSVTLLHRLVLRGILGISDDAQLRKENLEYVHTVDEVRDAMKGSKYQCAVLLNPTSMQQLQASAEAGVPMPQKSTYFYPKLLTGLVMNDVH